MRQTIISVQEGEFFYMLEGEINLTIGNKRVSS
jgi:hypothetical protein